MAFKAWVPPYHKNLLGHELSLLVLMPFSRRIPYLLLYLYSLSLYSVLLSYYLRVLYLLLKLLELRSNGEK